MPKVDYVQRILTILKLLKEETDSNHGMSSREIARVMTEKYGCTIDPRSVRSIISELVSGGFPIETDPKYFYRGVFTCGECEYLSQAIKFGSGLTPNQRVELLNRLSNLTSGESNSIERVEWHKPSNPEMLNVLATIREAIRSNRQISFTYGTYDCSGQLQAILSRTGVPKIYNAHPYQIVFANGRYYLLASVNKHSDISHYRIDRIISIRIRKAMLRPCPELIDVSSYIVERPYMYSGQVYEFRLIVQKSQLNDVLDRFGNCIRIDKIDDNRLSIIVCSDAKSMQIWTGRYGGTATIFDAN